MIFVIFIKALFILSLKGTAGQELKFNSPTNTSPCSKGLRADIDKVTFPGTVGKDFTSLVAKGWKTSIEIQMALAQSPDVFVKMCDVDFGASGSNCGKPTTAICFCDKFDTASGEAHFVVEYIVQKIHSKGVIRAEWKNDNDPKLILNKSMELPQFYDANKANVTLKMNNILAKQTSHPFGVDFLANRNNTIELCCIDSASPCFPILIFDEVHYTSDTNCVNLTVFAADVNFKANVSLEYSICNPSGNLTAGSGIISTVEAVPSGGDDSNNTSDAMGLDRTTIKSDGKPATAEEEGCPLFFCGLSIVLGLLFLAILSAVTCFVVWAKKHKRVAEVEDKPASQIADLDSFPKQVLSDIAVEDITGNPHGTVTEPDADSGSLDLEESPAIENNVHPKDDLGTHADH